MDTLRGLKCLNQADLNHRRSVHWSHSTESETADRNLTGAGLLEAWKAGRRLHPISEIPARVSGDGALAPELNGRLREKPCSGSASP